MENDLFPGYIDVFYHSSLAPHHATIPTREWNAGIGTSGHGGYLNWDDDPVDAGEMILDLVTAWVKLLPAEVTLDRFVINRISEPGASPQPVAGDVIEDGVGIMGTPGWWQAVQGTFTFYDTEFAPGKFVLLDCGSSNSFAPRNIGSLTADQTGLVTVLTDPANAFSSRNGARLSTLRSLRFDINDKLHKQYYG